MKKEYTPLHSVFYPILAISPLCFLHLLNIYHQWISITFLKLFSFDSKRIKKKKSPAKLPVLGAFS